jgi:hypothetical protein
MRALCPQPAEMAETAFVLSSNRKASSALLSGASTYNGKGRRRERTISLAHGPATSWRRRVVPIAHDRVLESMYLLFQILRQGCRRIVICKERKVGIVS